MADILFQNLSGQRPDAISDELRPAGDRLYRAMMRSLTQFAIILIDPKGIINSFNKGAELMLGYSESEVIGQSIALFYPLEMLNHDGLFMNLQEAFLNKNYQVTGWRQKKDGNRFLANVHYTALYDEDDHKLLGYTKIIYEASELEAGADRGEKIKDNIAGNISFRKLIENSSSGITLLDRNLNIIYRSHSGERISGWSIADRMKGVMGDFIHPDDREKVTEVLGTVLSSPAEPITCTFRLLHHDGYYKWIDCVYTNFLDEPNVNAIVSNFIDVSEIKNAEYEIQKKNAEIENLLENITDGFIALDENLCYTYANKQISLITGMAVENLLGKNVWEIFPAAVGSATYNAIMKGFTEKVYVTNEDYYAPLNIWQENRVYPTENGVSVFIRDVTERKIEEQQKKLLAEISAIFNQPIGLNQILIKSLKQLAGHGNFCMAELWLISSNKTKINLTVQYSTTAKMRQFYAETTDIRSFKKGVGLPGLVWQGGDTHFMQNVADDERFERRKPAEKAGVKSAYGVPLYLKNEITGVLVLGRNREEKREDIFTSLFEKFNKTFAVEIRRKQLEQELNQIFNYAPDVICIASIEGYFRKVNPAMCTLLGYTEQELCSRPIFEFIYEADRNAARDRLQDIAANGDSSYIENRYVTRSGKIKWLAWTTTPVFDDGLLFGVAKDITEKKELQELLNKANSLARIGAWEVDMNTGKVQWSAITREIHEVDDSFEPNLTAGINFYKEGESRDTIVKLIDEVAKTGVAGNAEVEIITATGNGKWVRVIVEAEMADGKCEHLYGSFQDISFRKGAEIKLKELNESLKRQARELATSNAELEQFAYVASHDLQEPLRMVTSFLNQLERKYNNKLDDKGRQYINFAVDGAKRMRQIILDLLEFSRVGSLEDNLELVNMQNMVTGILALYRKQVDEANATIQVQTMPLIYAGKTPLRQVLQNLISNSLKYSRKDVNPVIQVSCTETDVHWQIAVKDNGIGIEPQYFNKIFTIFQRLHNKEQYPGTGMGLAIAKKIVENWGGSIWVESVLGEGSVFYFTILKS